MTKRLNPDARAAITAAHRGNCKDALKYLYDAAPHNQTSCDQPGFESAVADFRTANVIVAGSCVVNSGKSMRLTSGGFDGARRRRKRRR